MAYGVEVRSYDKVGKEVNRYASDNKKKTKDLIDGEKLNSRVTIIYVDNRIVYRRRKRFK